MYWQKQHLEKKNFSYTASQMIIPPSVLDLW